MLDKTCSTCVKWQQAKLLDRGICMRNLHSTCETDSCEHHLSKEPLSITKHPNVQRLIKEIVRLQTTVTTLQFQVTALIAALEQIIRTFESLKKYNDKGDAVNMLYIAKTVLTLVEKGEDNA